MQRDTIVALSSGAVPAAIAIVRLSGPQAVAAATALAGTLPPPRTARVRTLADPRDRQLLDRAIIVQFDPPRTATGEALVEFHLHGSRAVVAAVEAALLAQDGVRRAEAGEFTRRALLNGRIDLTQAEGLADLLAAETEGQRRAALRVAEGSIGRAVGEWNRAVLGLAARVEAAIDFSDEEDGDPGDTTLFLEEVRQRAAAVATEVDAVLAVPSAERLRDGVRVVLAGPPNSGKSTLFNRLVEREAAIVSPIAGTTRDRIEAPVVIAGTPFVITDTAGLNDATDDPIEAIGVDRAVQAMASADIVLWLGDDDAPPMEGAAVVEIHARCDVAERAPDGDSRRLAVSARTGSGMAQLIERLTAIARELFPPANALALNARHRALLGSVAEQLHAIAGRSDLLLVAEALRAARVDLDRITGASDVEAMLDTLFVSFCIGK